MDLVRGMSLCLEEVVRCWELLEGVYLLVQHELSRDPIRQLHMGLIRLGFLSRFDRFENYNGVALCLSLGAPI
jgi:hypothetical protein